MSIPLSAKTKLRDPRWRTRRGSIRARLLIGFVLMSLLSAIGISIGSMIVGYVNGSQQVRERLDSVAALKTLAINNWATELQNGMLIAVNDQSADARISIVLDLARTHQYYDWYNEAVRLRLLTLIEQSQQFDELCLLDADGVVVLCTGSRQSIENCQAEAFFQNGLAGPSVELPFAQPVQKSGSQTESPVGNNRVSVLCHFKSTALDSSFVIAARPIIGSQGETLGVIAGRTGGGELTRILTDPTGLGGTGKAYLVNSLFAQLPTQVVPSASNRDAKPIPHSTGVDTALLNHAQVSGIYANDQGDQVFGVYRWLPNLQVVLAVEQTFTEAFEGILLALAVNVGIALVAVLLAVGASFLMTRSITQPLVGLVETASLIAAGDLERTAPVQREDEIAALATAFNSMTAQLRDLINHLEERVHERTQALHAANEGLQRRAVQMETSAQVSRQITSILSIDDLLARVVQLIQEAFGYFDARIFLLEGEELVLHTTAKSLRDGSQSAHRGVTRLRISQTSLNTEAVRTNQAVVVNDVTRDTRYLMEENLTDIRSELVIPLRVGERVIGTLDVLSSQLNTFTPEDLLVIQSLGDQVAIAIENARLYERSRELAVLEGRNLLARDLHDSVNQSLYSLNLLSEGWRRLVRSGEAVNVEEYFDRAAEISQQALGEMRLLLYELRPTTFEQGGLVGALQRRLDAVERRAGIEARLIADGLMDLPAPVQNGLYRIAQEALNNVLKHAGASQVTVRLNVEGKNRVVLQVSDNGRGFALDTSNSQGGMGLNNMRQRAQELGGNLVIESELGKGTTVTVTINYASVATAGSDTP